MIWTDDPERDADRHDQERIYDLPVCCECGQPIQDDNYYEVEGNVYCNDCMSGHRMWL